MVADLRSYVMHAETLPEDQHKAEVRLYASLITIGFALLLIEPIFYLQWVPMSMVSKVAGLAPWKHCVTAAFGICLAAMTPHLVSLLFRPRSLGVKWPRRCAGYAALGGAVTWLYLAVLAVPLDAGGLEFAYAIRMLGCAVIGVTYGFSINAQQGRELKERFHVGTA